MTIGDDSITHKDIALRLGVSETTVKSYRRKFPLFFPLHSHGKPLRFKPVVMDVALSIREGFQKDLSVEEIRTELNHKFSKIKNKSKQSSPIDIQAESTTDPSPCPGEARLEALESTLATVLQEQARTNEKLVALQELITNCHNKLLTAHEMQESAQGRLLSELRQLIQEQARHPLPESPEKRVIIRNMYGDSSEYRLATASVHTGEPPTPSAATDFSLPETPPEAILSPPLVVRSAAGEYLGIAGKSEGAFSLNDFIAMVRRSFSAPHDFTISWQSGEAGTWSMTLDQEAAIRPQNYVLQVESVTTPKGNTVTLLTRLDVSGKDMPPANLYAFIKQMKELPRAEDRPEDMS